MAVMVEWVLMRETQRRDEESGEARWRSELKWHVVSDIDISEGVDRQYMHRLKGTRMKAKTTQLTHAQHMIYSKPRIKVHWTPRFSSPWGTPAA
jgi:hypothetical protein